MQNYIPTDLPVLSCVQESLTDGPEDDTFCFRPEPDHLGNFRFNPGEIFYFSTAREAKPGDDVAVFLYRPAVDPTSREPVGTFEDLIIRKLISANDMEVVLGPSPGTGNENETIPRDRIKGVYPWIASVFGFQNPDPRLRLRRVHAVVFHRDPFSRREAECSPDLVFFRRSASSRENPAHHRFSCHGKKQRLPDGPGFQTPA